MKARSILEVDLSLIKENAALLKKMAGGGFFCPMLKANAYGHGAGPAARVLHSAGFRRAGLISAAEALSIQKAAPEMELIIFGPVLDAAELAWAAENHIVLAAGGWEDLKGLARLKKPARIHLKFDTGFSRLGFAVEEAEKLFGFLKDNPQIKLEGLASQLISGEEIGDLNSFSAKQALRLRSLEKIFSCSNIHFLNTSALIASFVHGGALSGGARAGIGLYGVKPKVLTLNEEAAGKWRALPLKPASRLKSRIISLRKVPKGGFVSYGGLWRAKRDSLIAAAPLGYADGFFRSLGAKREVLFRGRRRPVVGAVCMDFFMLDLTEAEGGAPRIGEELVIFGAQEGAFLSVEEQAFAAGSISYELFARLGPRVERVYKN